MDFGLAQKIAIADKAGQLIKLRAGQISQEELAKTIAERRMAWMKLNLPMLKTKYSALPLEEQAYNIIFLEHMGIRRVTSSIRRVYEGKIEIHSYNFCPYLEACKRLCLDTRKICKEVNESGVQEMIKLIHPNLVFSRDYNHIRPHKPFCLEFIELKP